MPFEFQVNLKDSGHILVSYKKQGCQPLVTTLGSPDYFAIKVSHRQYIEKKANTLVLSLITQLLSLNIIK